MGLTLMILGDLSGAAQDALAYAHGGNVHDYTDVRRKAGSPRVVGAAAPSTKRRVGFSLRPLTAVIAAGPSMKERKPGM